MTDTCATRKFCVYKHTSPSGKSYIGITCRKPEERWGKTGNGYRDNPKFNNAIQKYGWDSITHDILYNDLSLQDAIRLEREMIQRYDSFNNGYNATLGGEGCEGMNSVAVHCEETDTVYENQHIAADALGVRHQSISQCCNGKIRHTGGYHVSFVDPTRVITNQIKKKTQPRRSSHGAPRSVTMYDIDGHKLCDFPSMKAAAEATGDPVYLIGKCCNNKSHNCRDHRYAFRGQSLSSLDGLDPCKMNHHTVYLKSRSRRPVLQFDKNGTFVARYSSAMEASKATNISNDAITSSATKPNTMGYGYYWMYEDSPYELKPHKDRGPKRVLCIDTGEVFNTAREAEAVTGISYKAISRNCTGQRQSAGGLHFRFADIV